MAAGDSGQGSPQDVTGGREGSDYSRHALEVEYSSKSGQALSAWLSRWLPWCDFRVTKKALPPPLQRLTA